MPYLSQTLEPTATAPPEEQYVEPQAAPPEQEWTPTLSADGYDQVAQPAQEAPPQEAPPQEWTPTMSADGYEQAAALPTPPPPDNRMGGLVDPLMAQAPEPVRNLANIVGQPVGGLVDAAQGVLGQLGQGDIPGAGEVGFQTVGAPAMRGREQAGQRVAEGKSVTLTAEDMPQHGILSPILDPIANSAVGQAVGNVLTAPLPGTENIPPPPTAIGGAALGADPGAATAGQAGTVLGPLGIEDWWASLKPEDQQALTAQGGNAIVDAFERHLGAPPEAPPNLKNPFDAGSPGMNPIERAGAILGSIPGAAGAWGDTIQTGTLGPFLKNQAIEAAMDPTMLIPPVIGESLMARGKRLIGRTPGVNRLTDLTTEAKRAIQGEQVGTSMSEVVNSRAALLDAGVAPADPLTQGATSPSPNGRQPPTVDPGQAGSAAPPIPEPPRIVERPVAGVGSVFEVQQDGRVRGQFPTRESADEFINPRPRTAPPDPDRPRTIPEREPIRVATERVAIDEDIARRVRNGEITPQEAVRAQKERPRPTSPVSAAPPSREALGLQRSRWVRMVDGKAQPIVENGRVRPDFEPVLRRAYEDMKTAPPDQFWEPYPASHLDVNVPVGDEGAYARYRGAMTQALYMLDDWGAQHAMRRLPPETIKNGVIDWPTVERLAASGDSGNARAAQRAVAGKRAIDLYAERIQNAPDPDLEVEHMLTLYHLDQVSGRFDKPQYRDTSYWADRADAIGEAVARSGYIPSQEALARWRTMNLADAVREAFPDLADSMVTRRLDGKTFVAVGPHGPDLVVHTPGTERFGGRAVPVGVLTDTQYFASDLITPETRPALEAALRERLDKYGLSDVALRLVDTLSDVIRDAPGESRGVYQPFERIITLALREVDDLPLTPAERVGLTLDHEVIHALRALDLFTADEWSTLVRTAKEQDIGPQLVSDDYEALSRWNPAMAEEELVAHLYEAWRTGKVTLGRQPSIFIEKLFNFLRGLGLALKDTYPEDILRAVENGDIGRRQRTVTPAVERPAASLPSDNYSLVYHGSRTPGIENLRASLPQSERRDTWGAGGLGVFTTPHRELARAYASDMVGSRPTTRPRVIYEADVSLKNPYRISVDEFRRTVDNPSIDPSVAAAFKQRLIEQGHDGIYVTGNTDHYDLTNVASELRDVTEIVSFDDVSVRTAEQFALRRRRQASAAAAVSAAPEPIRQAVSEIADPHFTRYGVVASEQAARDLAQPADGMFHFRDGWRIQGSGLTVDDVLHQTLNDVEFWANVERISKENGGWSDTQSTTMMRRWQQLDKRFNPDGTVDRSLLAGPPGDLARQKARDLHALSVLQDAETRARPKNAPKSRIGNINEEYLGLVRKMMLFNHLNIARYVVQNVTTNSINMGARIGAKGVFDLWSHPGDFLRTARSARALDKGGTYYTRWGSREKQIGMGSKPNVAMSHVTYLADRAKGNRFTRGLDRASRLIAPDTWGYVGTAADQTFRESAAETVVTREYRRFNRELVPMVMKELDSRSLRIPDAKVRQVVHDFLDANNTLIDANTGEPYRTMLGRPVKSEPTWNPEAFGQYLKAHLTEDMIHKPDPGDFNRAIDRITRDSKTRVRGILDEAERSVDAAFFSWRDTNADAMLRKFFLFHYWTSRQGGFFLQEAVKRPVIMATYGRMMTAMQQQAEDLDQPNWMKGFFQLQNSVGGFSIWHSPFDLVQSLLTFADWEKGEDNAEYKDLTALGGAASDIPFLIHPLLQFVAYELGLLGPDYYPPMITGTETFGANAINLLNLANAQGKLPAWAPGHDANGNPIPLPVRPLQELYARVGNAISSALEPITGLSPVEVQSMVGSQQRNIASILETETRRANPEWDQMRVNAFVTEKLADPGSAEYQAAFRKAADMPYMLKEGMPGLLSGAMRLASPISIYNWPEQYNLDRWNVTPSGYVPPRDIPHLNEIDPATQELTPAGERAKYVNNAAKYGATNTPEARQLANEQNEWYALEPLDYAEANDLAGKLYSIYDGNLDETVTIGGVEYTPEMLRSLDRGDMYALGTQALADAGYTRDDQTAIKDAQARYLADHPDLAGFFAYKNLIKSNPNGVQGFVAETAAVNPGFRQFVRSSMLNHVTGEMDYDKAEYIDAYLASQGVRPSVYSPLVGNEPSTVPGGYPALSGAPAGQPLLPPVTGTEPFPLYSKPVDVNGYFANESLIAWIDPQLAGQMQTVGGPDPRYDMTQVKVGNQVGYVPSSYLTSAAPPQPTAMPGRAPAPVQANYGLASLAGNVTNLLGSAKDAIGGAITSLTGHNSGTPTKPASDGMPTGAYDVVPANDGIGVQSTRDGSDRTWMENMIGPGHAIVTTDYKGPTPAGVSYAYQDGHGADSTTHAAYDISCDTGYRGDGSSTCPGTPINAPINGRVICAGYGKGTGEAMGSPNCTYSQNTTKPGSAHDIVLDVGTDVAGNAIQLSFSHMGTSNVQPGQKVNTGDMLGGMGDTDGGPHVHLEAWGWCPKQGTYVIIDPQLVVGGYYQKNAVC